MNLSQLRYFLAVADAGSINGAAQALRIAQSAVSRQIRNLELDLGKALFDRHDRGVTLTRHGQDYALRLRPLLARLDALHREMRSEDPGSSKLRLGLNQFGQWHDIVVAALDAFRAHHPTIAIEGEMTLSRQQVEAIEANRLDLAIGAPLRGLPAGFQQIFLFDMPMGALMDRRHPLACADRLTLSALAAFPLVSYSRKTWPTIMDQVDSLLGAPLADFAVTEAFDDASLLLARPRDGRSIAIVPAPGRHAPMAGLVFRPVENLDFHVPIHLFWRTAQPGSVAAAFIDEVRGLVAQPPLSTIR